MMLVPRQFPNVLASACVGFDGSQVHCVGHSVYGHDELGGYYPLCRAVDVLSGEQRKTPVPAPDMLDGSEPRYEGVRNSEQLQHFALVVHANYLRSRPRAERPLATVPSLCASGSIYGYPTRPPLDLTEVNDFEQFARIAP